MILTFKGPIRFQIDRIVPGDRVWHAEGHFLVGKFQRQRILRIMPNLQWYYVREIEIPGDRVEQREGVSRSRGRRKHGRPFFNGKLYISPPTDSGYFTLSGVKVLVLAEKPLYQEET